MLIWGGPVFAPGSAPSSQDDIGRVRWGASAPVIITVNQSSNGGFSSGAFSQLAAELRGQGGILDALLARKGLSRVVVDKIAIAGFSAFHGLAAPLLEDDGERIGAALLLDACFSAVDPPWTKKGYVSFGARAAKGEKLMVYSSSYGGGKSAPFPSSTGTECAGANFEASLDAIGTRDVSSFDLRGFAPGYEGPLPKKAFRSGDLFLLDYQGSLQHGEHVHRLTEGLSEAFLVPFFSGEGFSGGLSSGKKWAIGLGIAAFLGLSVFLGIRLAKKEKD